MTQRLGKYKWPFAENGVLSARQLLLKSMDFETCIRFQCQVPELHAKVSRAERERVGGGGVLGLPLP